MNKTYDPKSFEKRIYSKWLEKKYFSARPNPDKKPFTIVMPPPNITGQLHMGHALDGTVQDILTRYKRMKGFEALWLPGTDHASIATEVKIVEKMRKEGLTKEMIGRDGFMKRAYEWKAQYGGRIVEQLREMGYSCDWDRLAFTMDERCSKAVKEVFVRMYEEGLIYRGDRIINWCPCCKTAISDAEVEYETEKGHLWHLKYPIENSDKYIVVATTRPETMLGDTAVAVNPSDKRYTSLVGKNIVLPLVGRLIPIIADRYVEKGFGTGAVKITPAHDPNDFEVGIRHDLPVIKVMNDDGTMNENAGKYEGMNETDARAAVVADMDELGLLLKTEDYEHNVGHCYRCHHTIEPMVSKQWFVRMKELAAPAIEAVKKKEIKFLPKRFEKTYLHWMENIRDWCISRQLWWGHRIPVYYCDDCGEMTVSREEIKVCPKCGKPVRQDEDVLDTWFSSALWPFSTLGWPDKTPDLDYFYPTTVLVTAYDIITFWVSRMIFSGLKQMGEKPFSDVLIHGIVRDGQGRKMSKSLGNGVDPLEVIDEYGADSLRYSLVNGIAAGGDIRYSVDKMESYRNFMNKIWNASRFVLMNCENVKIKNIEDVKLTLADKWILHELNSTVQEVTKNLDKYEVGLAAATLYDFIWSQFCDIYIEMSKTSLYSDDENKRADTVSVLLYVLTSILKLVHPFIPFITEEIYDNLPVKDAEDIMISAYPEYTRKHVYSKAAGEINAVMKAIKSIRALRKDMNVSQTKKTAIYIVPSEGKEKMLKETAVYIEKLANGNEIVFGKPQAKSVSVVSDIAEFFIPLGELVDVKKEVERLTKELENVENEIARAQGKLNNAGFVAKAPVQLIENEKAKLQKYIDLKEKIALSIENFKKDM
ncbi:MAG: valine--tRNA ligase [Firmicutes bacterium]|nr:valine--tRNA ligase [Bacillota bacterium]MDY5531523.1 valine--tRNA ligase [Pumilibacteraceae bacterium]